MAPTPPSADASSPSHDERTRRNVACVNCRNSKVRCKSSQIPGEPCQRCAKLQISCVVDKSHKRVTKRSKLEQLEQELRSIQQVVNKTSNSDAAWTPPTPRPGFPSAGEQASLPIPAGLNPVPPRVPTTPIPESLLTSSVSTSIRGPPPEKRQKKESTESRMLGNMVVSGENVDYYFGKFLQNFHPFLPILRKKDPDECYAAQPLLFWVIIYVATRRYQKDPLLLNALVEHINKNIWLMISAPALRLEDVHAILLVCAWPFPHIRFVTDPSSMLSNIALNACMAMGLHTGKGFHPQFCIGMRSSFTMTDEEASSTWFACCILAQRGSTTGGHPPPYLQHNDSGCKAALEATGWSDLIMIYDIQRFLNRMHTAMFAQTAASGRVPDHVVTMWESELQLAKPAMIKFDTDISRLVAFAARLEIQLYYFMGPLSNSPSPSPSNPNLRQNAYKTFSTAREILLFVIDFQSRSQFLFHGPNFLLRPVIDAAHIIIYLLHSVYAPPDITVEEANILAQQAYTTAMRCSIKEADLPYRGCILLETFWSFRHHLPKFDSVPPAWVNRGGAGTTYACLEKFKHGLMTAQRSTDGVNKALEIIQPLPYPNAAGASSSTTATTNTTATSTSTTTSTTTTQDPTLAGNTTQQNDPFQDVDWSMFMDDFGWGDDGVLLSLI